MTAKRQARPGNDHRPCWATVCPTARGYIGLAATAHGLIAACIPRNSPAGAETELRATLSSPALREFCPEVQWVPPDRGLPPHLAHARGLSESYAEGEVDAFRTVKIDLRPHPRFTAAVLDRVQQIPAGRTMTYGEVAAAVGSPRAARAVGQAMARNPLAPVVPCHRVLAAGGRLGGYGGGLALKAELLRMEGADVPPGAAERR